MPRKVLPPEMRLANPSVPMVDYAMTERRISQHKATRTPLRNEGTITGRIPSGDIQGFRIMDREAGLPLGSDYGREEADRAFRRLSELNASYPGRHTIKELRAVDTSRKGWV